MRSSHADKPAVLLPENAMQAGAAAADEATAGGDSRCAQVAALHQSSIHQGFLSTLGLPFLTLLYAAMDSTPGCVLITTERAGRVAGFVAGTTVGIGPVYRTLLRRPFALTRALLPALCDPRKLRRIVEVIFSGQKFPENAALPTAELLSIAVDEAYRREGLAAKLYCALARHFQASGTPAFRIVVGNVLNDAPRFYARMGARGILEINIHGAERSTVWVQSLPMSHNSNLSPERDSCATIA